jgi:hypothetical protein
MLVPRVPLLTLRFRKDSLKMRPSRSVIAILAFGLALPLLAQVNDTYVVPAVGDLPGANQTVWATQFSLFNPQAYPLTVSLTFLPTLGSPASDNGTDLLITVPANATFFADNLLSEVFKRHGIEGALLVATFAIDNPTVKDDVISRAFLVNSSTYNNARTGTFGQSIPGIFAGLQDDGITGIVHGIRNILGSQGFRTNVGAVNLGRFSATIHVTVFDADGKVIKDNDGRSDIPLFLPPQGHLQQALPVAVNRGSIEFSVDDPHKDAVVFAYASVIDPLSGDPTYHSPTLLASPSVLFPKSTTASTLSAGGIGKKIDSIRAAEIRDSATHLGEVRLVHADGGGYRVASETDK